MRGIIQCMKCAFFQSWIGKDYHAQGYARGVSDCRKCGRRNQFSPASMRWTNGERKGRTAAVWFTVRPEWMPRHALNQEAIARNLHAKEGVTMEEYIPAFRNALTSRDLASPDSRDVTPE